MTDAEPLEIDEGLTYAEAGVDVDAGDKASAMWYEANKATWPIREGRLGEVDASIDSFRGYRDMPLDALVKELEFDDKGELRLPVRMLPENDGIGNKIRFAKATGNHGTMPFDLAAMVIDDVAAKGGEAVSMMTNFDLNHFGNSDEEKQEALSAVEQLTDGLVAAAHAGDFSVVTGETAELGWTIQGRGEGFAYTWCGAAIAFIHERRRITGEAVVPGDVLVGFAEHGFRSNGSTLVDKIIEEKLEEGWQEESIPDGYGGQGKLGDLVLAPSIIYAKLMTELHGGYSRHKHPLIDIHGAAHITGGGIPNKLGDLLAVNGLGAVISDPFDPAAVMLYMQEKGGVSDREAYRWNMGHGMITAMNVNQVARLLTVAEKFGIRAKIIGEVVSEPGVKIKNRGVNARSRDEWLDFNLAA